MKRAGKKAAFATALLLMCAVPGLMSPNSRQPHAFLQKQFGFSQSELAAIDRGRIVTKLPSVRDPREIAALGVVRLKVSKEFFLEKFMDIESFKKSEIAVQIRKLSSPPRPEDFASLDLEPEHLKALKTCRVGDCDVKIPADLIERLRKEANSSARNHRGKATALTREFLLGYVRGYLNNGNEALVSYADQNYTQQLADEFRSMLEQSPYLLETAPELHKYLGEFPRMELSGADNFIYWSKEKVAGFKIVLGLTHVTVYQQKGESPFKVVIVSKQIYANHYFHGSLALTWLVDAESAAGKTGCYLIYLNRSRMDALSDGIGWLKRYVARGRVRDGLMKNIQLMREKVEGAPVTP